SEEPAESQQTRLREWMADLAHRPFELAHGPLVRIGISRMAPCEHIFLVVLHHAISDGWSLSLLFQELSEVYNAFDPARPTASFPQLPLQYVDFAHWQRQTLQGPLLDSELEYWRKTLAGAPVSIQLPTDCDLPESQGGKAARSTTLLDAQLVHEMNQ